MISMPQIQSIRSRRRNGESIASIARSERVSEPTVRKYLRVDDLSARPPVRRRRGSVIDEWLPMIEGMLAEDRETWRKQRHTATRIHERLRDEYGAGVSLSTVTRTVARCVLMLLYIVKRLGVLFWVGCRVYPLDGPLLEFGKVACAAFDLADAARGHAERLADLLLGDVPADA